MTLKEIVNRRLRSSLLAIGAAAVAAVVGFTSAAVGQTADTPRFEFKQASCTTDAKGECTVSHTLGVVPSTVVVSANTPGSYNAFMLNTIRDSFTASTFKVRAMFSQSQPKANGTIWFSYAAYAAGAAVPPPPPPPSSSTVPPVTTPPPSSSTVPPPSTTPAPPPSAGCASPTKIVEQDGRTFDAPGTGGQYYVHNDAWNWQGHSNGQYENLYLCNYNNWSVDSWGFKSAQGEVFMYPSTKWDATSAGCCAGRPLSTWPNTFSGRFAGTTNDVWKTSGSYDVAWDLWLNGVADNNSLELMVWTEKAGNADPAGTKRGTFTASDGHVYDVWWDGAQKGGYLAFISQTPQPSGTVDLHAMIDYATAKGYLPAGVPTVNQVNYGIEVRDSGAATQANPARFTLTDYGLTMN